MNDEASHPSGPQAPRWIRHLASLRSPAMLVIALTTCLAVLAGFVVVSTVAEQMAREADTRLERHVTAQSESLQGLMLAASRDIRLARRNDIFQAALARTPGQLLPEDRRLIESAITYLGDRYRVDEICVIRAGGLETARWVGGKGVAPVEDLSPDERLNNPAVVPTVPLADDSFYQTPPYVSPDSARWVIGIATPIILPNGDHAGILHFEIPIQRFADVIAAAPFGRGSYGLLLDRAGHMLAGPRITADRAAQGLDMDPAKGPFPVAFASGSASWQAAATAVLSGSAGSLTFDDDGVASRATYRPVDGSDRILAMVVPTSELYADAQAGWRNLAVSVVPLILLIVLASGWFTHRLSGTNRRLAGVNGQLQTTNQLLATSSRSSAELAAIVRAGDDAMMSVALDGRIETWNDGALHMYGLTAAQAMGSPVAQLFRDDGRAEAARLLDTVAAGEAIQRHEIVHVTAGRRPFDASVTVSPIRDDTGTVIRAALVVRDISDRKRLEEELAHQALHDSLTGLPNRVLFQDRLRHSLDRARRALVTDGTRRAVLFIDLDDFKLINDAMGHSVGDELLVAVAARMREAVRPGDTAARLGGDEFTVLLEDVDEPAARAVADRILARVREPFDLDGSQAMVTASIGIVLSDALHASAADLIRSADTALYEAKRNGKARYEMFHPQMTARVWQRLEFESEIRRALANAELVVHYQPIVDLRTGCIREVEALVRWQHPDRGLLPPADFIPLSEETGLIVDIGAFVLRTACVQLADWRRDHVAAAGLVMSVNVSARELREPTYLARVRVVLEASGLPADRLKLEITESVALDEAGLATVALAALAELGVHLSIDDFGTGYSSLGSFRRRDVDSLKIDRLFIGELADDARATAIIAAALAFGSALGLEVVAEGIETEAQAKILRELQCGLGQGYLFSRPLSAVVMGEMLQSGRTLRGGADAGGPTDTRPTVGPSAPGRVATAPGVVAGGRAATIDRVPMELRKQSRPRRLR